MRLNKLFETLIFRLSALEKVIYLSLSLILYYALLLALHPMISYTSYMFSFIPIFIATTFFGIRGGTVLLIIISLTTAIIFSSITDSFSTYLSRFIGGSIMTLVIIFFVGKIRQLTINIYDEYNRINKLERERELQSSVIEQQDRRLSRIFNNANFGIYRATTDGRLIMANEALARIFKFPDVDSLIQNMSSLSENNPFFKNSYLIELFKDSGKIENYDNQWQALDGTIVYISESAWAVSAENGDISYIEGVIEDITDRFLAENELKKSEKRFRSIFENASAGLYRRSPNGSILMANNQLLTYLVKIAPEELKKFNPEEEQDIVDFKNSIFYRELEKNDKIIGFESSYKDLAGNLLYFSESAWLVKSDDNNIICIEGIIQDISDRKKAENSVKLYVELLEKEIEERNKVVAELQTALLEVKKLSGLLPICARCKSIRDDAGYWTQIEEYVSSYTDAQFSHGLCPKCTVELYPDYADETEDEQIKSNDEAENNIGF